MKNIIEDLEGALVEVRKAYRLLWLFHRRVFDTFRIISEQLNANYYFNEMENKPGQPGYNILERWVWGMLPMQQMSMFYLNKDHNIDAPPDFTNYPQMGDYLLDIRLTVDSGRDDFGFRGRDTDPQNFKPAEECMTNLCIYIFVNKKDRGESINWFYNIWKSYGRFPYPESGCCKQHPIVDSVEIYGEIYDLAEFYNNESILVRVKTFKENVRERMKFNMEKRQFL